MVGGIATHAVEGRRRAARTRRRGPLRGRGRDGMLGRHLRRHVLLDREDATVRKNRIVAGAVLAAACALAGWWLLLTRDASGQFHTGFGPLPPAVEPPDIVKLTPVEGLGKTLISDAPLSAPVGYNCSTCHIVATGGTSGPSSLVNLFWGPQPGVIPGRAGKRRPTTYYYAAFSPLGPYFDADFAMPYIGGTFWVGRTPDLAGQAHEPFIVPNEMANIPDNGVFPPVFGGYSSLVVEKAIKNWGPMFDEAFYPGILETATVPEIYALITQAIAAYESSGELNPFS